jgi:hypothetical protein
MSPSINIKKFSGVPLATMTGTSNAAFFKFAGKITATDVPTIPNNTLQSCFSQATASQFGNINGWNVSNVTNMISTFQKAINFNQSLLSWNTAKVTSIMTMFDGATTFSQSISKWNFTQVKKNIKNGSAKDCLRGTAVNSASVTAFILALSK